MKLEIGYNHSFEVRTEELSVGKGNAFSILYASDLHYNAFSKKNAKLLIHKIAQLKPTIILFGGDYVDSKKGLLFFSELACTISCNHVFAIAGNHDNFWGLNKIKAAIASNIIWLDNASTVLNIGATTVRIDGGKPFPDFSEADLNILFTHKPVNLNLLPAKYHLIFSGHLHGCQFVLWENKKGLYPGRLFYQQNILKAQKRNCLYLISKGLGDTLPLRYNCKKDIIFVSIT